MAFDVACLAPDSRRARAASRAIAERLRGPGVAAYSLGGYADAPGAPRRVVLCPAGRSVPVDLAFLKLASRRLLWPAPHDGFRDAIGGIRPHPRGPRPAGARARRAARPATGGLAAALLLEGPVGPDRVRAALAAASTRHWIVESARLVRLPARLHAALERRGIRWSTLEPIEVVALYASPALARARAKWKALLPDRTPVWIRDERA